MASPAHTFYVIGLGSMGKRRIRNLLALRVSAAKIFGFDPDKKRCREAEDLFGIETETDFERGFASWKPDVFIISTPPDKHSKYFLFAAKRKIHFFVEVTTVDGYYKLLPLLHSSFVAAPSATFRHAPGVLKLHAMIEKGVIGKPLFFQHYLGQYLPDWHPHEDYRKVYFSKKKTGGAREMFPHELQWLNFLVGSRIAHASGIVAKVSELSMNADDVYSAVVRYKNGIIGSVNIDLLNRTATRTLRIVGSLGTLEWDWLLRTITILKPKGKSRVIRLKSEKKLKHYNTTENIYIAEMKAFLDAVNGKKAYPYSFAEDKAILEVLYAVENSSRKLL
ncbi:MAG: Gfo/Idh/MocA family oxidoreductase [bacterium]|nr:Gfo/Idh/MocA family oxidoreductase [bacterium]